MRVGIRTLVLLASCAAAAAAALAHFAIDVVGDYALPADSYDRVSHDSRGLISGIALVLAVFLAARGLRICCDIAAFTRSRILAPVRRLKEGAVVVAAAVAGSIAVVPAMECLDGRIAGVPVHGLNDAFGGSLLLGLATTIVCAVGVALLVYGVARWLISHRDSIATIIGTLLRRIAERSGPSADDLTIQRLTPRRRRTAHALRLSKRGPPEPLFA